MNYMQGVAKVFQPSYWFDQSSIAIVDSKYLMLYNHSSMEWVMMPLTIPFMLRILYVIREQWVHAVSIEPDLVLVMQYINKGQHYEEGFMFSVGEVSAFLEENDIDDFTALIEALSIGVSSL